MAKTELKTTVSEASVEAFIATVQPEQRQIEARELIDLFYAITGEPPRMWGSSIIGFGSYDYKYDSGREGTMCRAGFSPRKAKLTIYLMHNYPTPGEQAAQEQLFARLGKHKVGKSCIYINHLDQIDSSILQQLIGNSWAMMNQQYPSR